MVKKTSIEKKRQYEFQVRMKTIQYGLLHKWLHEHREYAQKKEKEYMELLDTLKKEISQIQKQYGP